MKQLKQIILGMATYLPMVNKYCEKGTGGTDSARYCYSIWLRHLVMAKSNGLDTYPKIVAELGPGDSLGIGLAALISGCDKYFALDAIKHANTEQNIKIFDELVTLFKKRTSIPEGDEFPDIKPYLENYDFPADILDENRLQYALELSRIEKIRNALSSSHTNNSIVQYKVPWYNASILEKESVDMIYSQAVLEHVDDLRNTYKSMRLWLKPSGYVSHQIDYNSHGTAVEWNGHWVYSDLIWKLIKGNRAFLLNREPHSRHIAFLEEEGYRIVCNQKTQSKSTFALNDLAARFKSMTVDDLTTSDAFIQAI